MSSEMNPQDQAALKKLRDELDLVDSELIRVVAQRQSLVTRIGELKQQGGRQTRDFAREKVVLERVSDAARKYDLDAQLARNILALLIRASLTSQEQARIRATGAGNGQTVLVVGGAGRMGRWFAEFFHSQGYTVTVADPAYDGAGVEGYSDWRDAGVDYDIIVLATTLATTGMIMADLCALKPAGLVFDVGSLKTPLREGLLALAAAGVEVTSIHPMFGPSTQLLAERQVIFVDVGVPEATARARALFSNTMASCIEMDIDEHDQLIAFVLGLSHLTNIAFVDALARSGIPADRLLTISSPTFDAQLRMGRTVVHENPHLYYEIQHLNGLGARSREALNDAIAGVLKAIESGDETEFVRVMRESRAYLEQESRRKG